MHNSNTMKNITTVTQKGQVTIPQELRKRLNIKTGTKLRFDIDDKDASVITIHPVKDLISLKGAFKTNKKYDKQKARKAYMPDVLAGKI